MLCESPDAIEQLNISVEDWIKGQLFLAYIAKLVNLVVMFTLRDSVQVFGVIRFCVKPCV